ncbi:unnamed protein product [Trichobilharzia szidati]|nr:unnamed protein product [Trichobilharzia szidati]CAH8841791.1 unnamed protein product [Trichobilharzia szidati]
MILCLFIFQEYQNEVNKNGYVTFCELCVTNVRRIRSALLHDYVREMMAKLLSVTCSFIPYRKPRAKCKAFFNGPFQEKLHDFAMNMSVNEPCRYIGVCLTEQNEMMTEDVSSFDSAMLQIFNTLKEHLKFTVTQEYIQEAIEQICSSDKQCFKTFEKYANTLMEVFH